MKKLTVKSRYKAIDHRSDEPWAVISVTTPDGRPLPSFSPENRLGVLRLCFYDANSDAQNWEGKQPGYIFDRKMAKQILDFTNEYWDQAEEFLIHCDMGMSRSPAVAAAIAYIKGGRGADEHWFKNYTPNSLVYRTILEEHHGVDPATQFIQTPPVLPEIPIVVPYTERRGYINEDQ